MPKNKALDEIKQLDFASSLKKLEEIVDQIENPQNSLEKSIDDYEYGIELKNHLFKKLDDAKLKIEKISKQDQKED